MKILIESTPLALWYEAIHKAQADSHIVLKADIESYLVFLLMRYVSDKELAKEVIAVKFLKCMQYPYNLQRTIMQNVGDQCLLISGLFPALAEKRHVKVSYFIDIGQIAYEVVSKRNNDLYSLLSKQFLQMMNVLRSFRPNIGFSST
ncbi:MAG TPA: hypothetical protein VHA13_04505 [Gammaproteobacteria bacterium]|nr:hypothetical protein [Gammaproteobacteria bacterium]